MHGSIGFPHSGEGLWFGLSGTGCLSLRYKGCRARCARAHRREYSEATCSKGACGVLKGYSQGTHGVLTRYSRGTRRLLQGYIQAGRAQRAVPAQMWGGGGRAPLIPAQMGRGEPL